MSKDNIEKDELKTFKRRADILEVLSSVGMAMAPTSIIASFIGNGNLGEYLAITTGGTILLAPAIYYGMKHLTKKLDERVNRDMHQAGQLAIMLQEIDEKNRPIGSMTSLFLNEILDRFELYNPTFPEEQIMNINQFIYLINSNYYEEISKINKNISRERLVKKLVAAISTYLNDTERDIFNEIDAKKVLYYVTIIPEDIKQEIAKEFKKSKTTINGETTYEIIRKDIQSSISEYKKRKEMEDDGFYYGFDIEDINDYYQLIQCYTNDQYYVEFSSNNPKNLDWDINFLRKIIKTMVKNHQEEMKCQVKDYTVFHLTSSFIDNALMYAMLNNKSEVGQEEMLNTFKNWNYVPFNIRLSTINRLFEEDEIDYSKHPFGIPKKKPNQVQKIIQFKPKQRLQ